MSPDTLEGIRVYCFYKVILDNPLILSIASPY